MNVEYVVWGRKPGAEAWEEQLLKTGLGSQATAEEWKLFCERKGFVNVRIGKIDLTVKPDFVATINQEARTA